MWQWAGISVPALQGLEGPDSGELIPRSLYS